MKQNTTQNLHILIVKHIGATDTKPARVKVVSERFKQSVTLSYTNDPGSINPALDTADQWLVQRGFNIIAHGEGKDHLYTISDTFEPIIP